MNLLIFVAYFSLQKGIKIKNSVSLFIKSRKKGFMFNRETNKIVSKKLTVSDPWFLKEIPEVMENKEDDSNELND